MSTAATAGRDVDGWDTEGTSARQRLPVGMSAPAIALTPRMRVATARVTMGGA